MGRPRVSRTVAIGIASAAIHICLLSALAIEVARPSPIGSPEPAAIHVTLERLPAPAQGQKSKSRPTNAMPRPSLRKTVPDATAAPVVAQPATRVAPAGDIGAAEMGNLVRALRGSVACSNPDAANLTTAERDACRQRLHAGLEEAKSVSGLSPRQKAIFDAGVKRDMWLEQPFLAEQPTKGCAPRITERPPPSGGGQEWKGAVKCVVPF
jgi:hypothetical protein